jgi:Flp pilus assembly protein TadD
MYRRAVQLRPAFWQNQNSLGGFLLRQGQLQEAAAAFQKVIELHPEADRVT